MTEQEKAWQEIRYAAEKIGRAADKIGYAAEKIGETAFGIKTDLPVLTAVCAKLILMLDRTKSE